MDKFGYCLLGFVAATLIGIMLHFAFPYHTVSSVPYDVTHIDTAWLPSNPVIKDDIVSKAKLKALESKYQYLLNNMPQNVDIAALQREANEYWQKYYLEHPEALQGLYAAQMDTTIVDSNLTIWNSYVSPIPLHPSGFFLTGYELKLPPIRTITQTVSILETTHWYNHIAFQIGAGTIYSKKHDDFSYGFYFGLGYSYNF